ncbi:hypothetical protein Ciccas_003176 [Cichlidogyrus casuarinus]|uniref:Androglobin n=1 Tax=Cichlidogyrus casuarinus TaxID=1844966 RepID=A0ABD2QFI4_9PLAT
MAIWPEWSDTDINAEKWESATKGKERSKSPLAASPICYEDPEGQPPVPFPFRVSSFKRPPELLLDQNPIMQQPEILKCFDLITPNENLLVSQFYRNVLCDIGYLWNLFKVKAYAAPSVELNHFFVDGFMHNWRPWEHIYSISKVAKGPNMPQVNPFGKYAVKLFWMGSWRKILVDDQIPCDLDGNLLLPRSPFANELWPMILIKALLKVASVEINLQVEHAYHSFSAIHCLTGWVPHQLDIIPSNMNLIWDYLSNYLNPWVRPVLAEDKEKSLADTMVSEKPGSKDKKTEAAKKDQKKGPEKEKSKCSLKPEELMLQNLPETYVFAHQSCNTEKSGFLAHLTHPVLVKQARNIPVAVPKLREEPPAWKLIRPLPEEVVARMEKEANNLVDPRERILEVGDAVWAKNEAQEKEPIQSYLIQSFLYNYKTQEERLAALQDESMHSLAESVDQEATVEMLKLPVGKKSRVSLSVAGTLSRKSSSNIERASPVAAKKKPSGTTSRAAENPPEEAVSSVNSILQESTKELWVDLRQFLANFSRLTVYHKSASCNFYKSRSEIKNAGTVEKRGLAGAENQYLMVDCVSSKVELLINVETINCWPPANEAQPSELHMRLPLGRHCFQFIVDCPLGYNLNVLATNIINRLDLPAVAPEAPLVVFGDKQTLFSKGLVLEPLRVKERGLKIIANLNQYVRSFFTYLASEENFDHVTKSRQILWDSCHAKRQKLMRFLRSIFLDEATTAYAYRILFDDHTMVRTMSEKAPINEEEVTALHLVSAVRIQALIRGFLARQRLQISQAGERPTNDRTKKFLLAGVESILNGLQDTLAVRLVRELKINTFISDEANCINLTEFSASTPELSTQKQAINWTDNPDTRTAKPSSWMNVLFRDILYTTGKYEKVSILIEFKCSVSAVLNIVDNESQEELATLKSGDSKLLSFAKRDLGYTFLAYKSTADSSVAVANWTLRLIGSGQLGPHGTLHLNAGKEALCNSFTTQEFCEYYKPTVDKKALIFKQSINVSRNQLLSLHAKLSDPNVPMRMFVKEKGSGKIWLDVQGTGEVRVPYCMLKCGPQVIEQTSAKSLTSAASSGKKSPSRGPSRQQKTRVSRQGSTNKVSPQRKPKASTASSSNSEYTHVSTSQSGQTKCYKLEIYIDPNQWPLSLSNWRFLDSLQQQLEDDMKVFGGASGRNSGRASAKPKLSRPSSVAFDTNFAHFRLKVLVDSEATGEEISFAKPTQGRVDQIKALKRAWEEADPGRWERAQAARERFLQGDTASRSHSPVASTVSSQKSVSRNSARSSSKKSTRSTLEVGTESGAELYTDEQLDKTYCLTPPAGMYEGFLYLTENNNLVLNEEEQALIKSFEAVQGEQEEEILREPNIPNAVIEMISPLGSLSERVARFKNYFAEWDSSYNEEVIARCLEKRKFLGLVQILQVRLRKSVIILICATGYTRLLELLKDKTRLMYYENCEEIRLKRLEEEEKKAELLRAMQPQVLEPEVLVKGKKSPKK